MLTTLLTTTLLMALQEPSLVSGSYRGPIDEAEFDMLNFGHGSIGSAGQMLYSPESAWDRWELWFENERDTIIRGEADFPAVAVNEHGAYGAHSFSLQRDEFLLESVPLLIEATLSKDPAVRESALISLGRIAYPATSPFIIEALDDGEESVRQAAYISLGLMSTPETTAVLIDAFENSRDYNARCFAAVGLGLSGRVDAAHSLNEFLGELKKLRSWRKVDDLVISTLIAVRVNSNADFSDNLMSVAQRMDKCKASDELKVAAIDALAIAGGIQAIEVIIENVKSKSQLVAESCVVSLGRLGNRVAVNALTAAFENSRDPRMKGMIQISLGQIADNKAKKFLSENQPRIADELYVHTSWLIACGLAKLDSAYTQVANTALYGGDFNKHDDAVASRSDEYELRGAAALSLGLYGAPAARVQLEKCLKETIVSDQLSSHIATALGMLGTDEAAQVLLSNVEQFNYSAEARRGFATALGMCSTEEANAQLADLLLNDADPTVRWTSAHALAGARDQNSLKQLVGAIREDIHQAKPDGRTAHLVLGLGYLGDAHKGATLEAIASNLDYRQNNELLTCLKSY